MVSPKKAVSGNQRLQAPYELMPVDLIGNHHCDQLADSGHAPGFLCFGIVLPLHLWTDELHGGEAAAQMGFTALSLHGEGRVMWTAGDAVFIKGAVGIFQGEPAVEWDESLFEMELVEEVMVDLYGVKGGIPQEGFWIYERVHAEEVLQDGDEGLGIGKGLVLVRGIGFLLYDDIRVCLEEIPVVEGDAADDAQPVGHEAELVGIAEMPVDVHLLDGGVGFGVGRHGGPV